MQVELKEVKTKKDLKAFIRFQLDHYKGNSFFVPPIIMDEISTFSADKNPAFETAEAKLFLAYSDGHVVGRIAAIISHAANKKYKSKNLRIGWVEFVEDYSVAEVLYRTAEYWGKAKGMTTMTGPQGFTDLDPQGMLIEGFDRPATIASYYHKPYYKEYTERYGFEKEIDYVEYLSVPPYQTGIPEKILRTAEWVKKRSNFKIWEFGTVRQARRRGKELFKLLEESFANNYGTVPLTDKQVDYYIKRYLPYVNKELLKIVVNDSDEMVGFMITMTSLSKAFQKAKGRLFPFGAYHIIKALKKYETLDFYFAGVKNEYRGKGVDLLMVVEIVKSAMKLGFRDAESNQELEDNTKVQAEWKLFTPTLHKRRRIYKKIIT